jgi:hypothetical protein
MNAPLTYSIGVPVALTITVVVGSNHVRGWSEACADDEIYDNGKGIYRHAQGDEEEAACEAADTYVGSAFAALAAQPELLAALRALLPYALSRAEDLQAAKDAGNEDPAYPGADAACAAVESASALLARFDTTTGA